MSEIRLQTITEHAIAINLAELVRKLRGVAKPLSPHDAGRQA
jgi:hypothetical protein